MYDIWLVFHKDILTLFQKLKIKLALFKSLKLSMNFETINKNKKNEFKIIIFSN